MPTNYIDEARIAAEYIKENLQDHFLYYTPYRFCLEIFHRTLIKDVDIRSPSLELGIGCGAASWFMLRGKGNLDFGGDMPMGATTESRGLEVEARFDHYNNLVGLDMSDLPFPDASLATVMSSETMFYGQNLENTFSEIFRVLAPGGIGALFLPTAEWLEYEVLHSWIKSLVPTAMFPQGEYFANLIGENGGEILHRRKYFSSVFEASMLLNGIYYPYDFTTVIRDNLQNPAFADEYSKRLSTLQRMVEKELAKPDGPDDAFHEFILFRKPGVLPSNLTPPTVMCLKCRGMEFHRSPTEAVCAACGATYDVRCGVNMMLRDANTSYSPTALQKISRDSHRHFETIVHQLVETLSLSAAGPFIHNGNETPIPKVSEASVLAAAMRYHGIQPAGIFQTTTAAAGLSMRGLPVIGRDEVGRLADGGLVSLVRADRVWEFVAGLAAQGAKGTFHIVARRINDGAVTGEVVTRSL